MKLRKGSAQAKEFMKKLRDARGKKKKISGLKRKPKDLGSGIYVHNQFSSKDLVKGDVFQDADYGVMKWNGKKWISVPYRKAGAEYKKIHKTKKTAQKKKSKIGASGDYAKFEITTIKHLAKLLKKPIKVTQKIVYDHKNLLDLISSSFDQKKTPSETAKILKAHLVPKKEIKPLDAFVNLLTKKGKGSGQRSGSANFPMKLPATVTIGSLKSDSLQQIEQLNRRIEGTEKFIKFNQEQLKEKHHLPQDKIHFNRSIRLAKKYQASYKKQIRELKKHI